jgi:hypothetical protein
MKKMPWFLLACISLPSYSQSILNTLNEYQDSLEPESSTNGAPSVKKPGTEVVSTSESSAVGSGKCEENDQKSLPLSYVTSLIQSKNAMLDVSYDPRKAVLQVSAPDMISNCSSMLEWKLKEQEIGEKKAYAVEVKIKNGEDCTIEGCEYKVAKVEGGTFKEWEKIRLKPTLKGFEECLGKSGVIENGKVRASALYTAPILEKFPDVIDSGKVLFVSHGPSSALIKPKYGKFDTIDKCDYYENINPKPKMILSLRDEEQSRLDEEASKLKSCSINEYSKVADFIERYESYASELGQVRDKLILEASKKAAKAIEDGKYTEDDFKVMHDFDKYIVQPRIARIRELYNQLQTVENEADKSAIMGQIKPLLAELKTLNAKPYFLAAHTLKLIKNGQFEEAEKLNTTKLLLDAYSKVGTKSGNTVVTPEVAASRVLKSREKFAIDLETEKETYAIRTGEVTGKSDYYKSMAGSMRYNIQLRTQNYNEEIMDEYSRVQPNGYCYKYFRNTQKCIQDSMERIQELQAQLQHYNKIDSERAAEYDEKAKEYGKLEAEGRRYVAAQNGEEVPEEKPADEEEAKPADTTRPTRRTSNGTYTFDYNPNQGMPQSQGQQQMGMPSPMNMGQSGMFQQPYNPYQSYGSYGQQQPFMGQQAYGGMGAHGSYGGYPGSGSYNFQWGGGAQQPGYSGYGYGQQPSYGGSGYGQQPGYWGQPYQAYSMYSMYGR